MTKFNGLILNGIRDAFDLTRKELSEKIHVSEQALWQYERGLTSPSYEVLKSLESVFMVERSFFLVPDELNVTKTSAINVINQKNVAYRSSFKAKTKRIAREQAYLNLVHNFVREVTVGLTETNEILSQLRGDVHSMLLKSVPMDEIGVYVREKLGVQDDNRNLIPAIERAGAYIVERGMADDVDAYSTWTEDGMPIIVLGSTKQVAVRRNFDVAHELGHLLMHYHWDLSDENSSEYKLAEKMANEFAASLTLPFDSFTDVYKRLVTNPTEPDCYKEIKLHYNISMQAIAYRASKLEIISKQDVGYFYGKMKKRKLNIIEPLDREIRPVSPGKIRAFLTMRRDFHFYKITEIMSIKPEFLTILGLDKMFIRSLKLDTKGKYENNVINLFGKIDKGLKS